MTLQPLNSPSCCGYHGSGGPTKLACGPDLFRGFTSAANARPPAPEAWEDETAPLPTHCEGCGARYTMADLVGGHQHARAPEPGPDGRERVELAERRAAAAQAYDDVVSGVRQTVARLGAGHPWVLSLEGVAQGRFEALQAALEESRGKDARRRAWRGQLVAVAEILGVVARARRTP
jgi:hypothetical protein